MTRQTRKKIFALYLLIIFTVSGCGPQFTAHDGKPIEPITPDMEEGNSPAVGTFNVKNNEIVITDLAVTADGSLTVVAAAKVVYLLQGNGNAVWEKHFTSQPQKIYMDPDGRFLAVGTEDGRLTLLTAEKTELLTAQFDLPVSHISATKNGELLLVGLNHADAEKRDKIVALRLGKTVWEKEVGSVLKVKIAGADNRFLINWQEGDKAFIGAFSSDGEPLWEVSDSKQLKVDSGGQIVVSSDEQEILRYNKDGKKIWGYTTSGSVERIEMAESGLYLAAKIKDETTQHEELLYLDMEGYKLWQKKMPIGADFLVSADGSRVIISSWRQYQDDVTKIIVYNQQGQEVTTLDIAGRAQKMAFAAKADILVLGLEDGKFYYINTAEKKLTVEQSANVKELTDYYNPVTFTKTAGEVYLQLFFFDDLAQHFIPVTRSIKNTQSSLSDTIAELVRGPAEVSGLMRTIPKEAAIGVSEQDGAVIVDLPVALDQQAGTTFLSGVLDSLYLTVSSRNPGTIKEIRFTVAGKTQETFGQEGILLEDSYLPLTYGRQAGETLLFLPSRSGGRFYLRPYAKSFTDKKGETLLQAIAQTIVSEFNRHFHTELALKSVYREKGTIYVDFTSSFNNMLLNSAQSAARAALLRDAIALSLAENATDTVVKLTVWGVDPFRPELYLPWEVSVTRPYYINMEN